MSKKYLALLVIPALILVVALMALPRDASATQLLGITITPTPIETQPEPPTPTPIETQPEPPTATPIITEEPQGPTPTPTVVTQTPLETSNPNPTEIVLLPETGEFPIDPAQGIQWFFVLTMIFFIGLILFRTFRTAKIKNK